VLQGLARCFDRRAVRVLQFEYNWFAIEGGFLLKDAYAFLRARDYVVGQMRRDGVLFMDYRYALENFEGPNYLACRREDAAAIAALEAA
jgi:hypothetical protein